MSKKKLTGEAKELWAKVEPEAVKILGEECGRLISRGVMALLLLVLAWNSTLVWGRLAAGFYAGAYLWDLGRYLHFNYRLLRIRKAINQL